MSPEEIRGRDEYNANRKFLPEETKKKRRATSNAWARKKYKREKLVNPAKFLLRHYKQRDKECELTLEWVNENIVNKKCTYCGYRKGICCDRKDSSRGYKIDNCVPACQVCNVAKWNHISYEDFFSIGKIIKRLRKLGKIK